MNTAFDDWTVRGFNSVDRNNDSVIVPDEWHFDRASFRRADHNDDGVITRASSSTKTAGRTTRTRSRISTRMATTESLATNGGARAPRSTGWMTIAMGG